MSVIAERDVAVAHGAAPRELLLAYGAKYIQQLLEDQRRAEALAARSNRNQNRVCRKCSLAYSARSQLAHVRACYGTTAAAAAAVEGSRSPATSRTVRAAAGRHQGAGSRAAALAAAAASIRQWRKGTLGVKGVGR